MVIDEISRIGNYRGLSGKLSTVANWVARTQLKSLSLGRHAIDGDHVFAIAMAYQTRPASEVAWEAHKRYADVHVILEGSERVGFGAVGNLVVKRPYDHESDAVLFSGDGDTVRIAPSQFVLFAPAEPHQPGIHAYVLSQQIRKVVIKVTWDHDSASNAAAEIQRADCPLR